MFHEEETPFIQEQIRTKLYQNQSYYEAKSTVRDTIQDKTLVGVVGPFAIGKASVIQEAVRQESLLTPFHTTTTRARKATDPQGYKTASEGVTYAHFQDAVEAQALVNYSVIPGAAAYGTFPEDFVGEYTIGSLLPSSIEHTMAAGFKETHYVYLLSPGTMWRAYINKSRSTTTENLTIRAHEALDSI